MTRHSQLIDLVLGALIVVGCTGTTPSASSPTQIPDGSPAPSPLDAPSPTFDPTPAPTASAVMPSAAPTAPPDLARIAAKEVDGIRVRVELERNPLPAGEVSWVKVSVTNRGRSNVTWLHDGCASVAGVGGRSTIAWPMGAEQSGIEATFKAYALGGSIADEPEPFAWFGFVPEDRLNLGGYGCADIGITEKIKPGETRRQTRWWSGFESQNRSIPPAGPVELSVQAGYYWRGARPDDIPDSAIKYTFPGWIDAPDQIARLSPAQVVDAALDDPEFSSFLQTQDIGNGREAIAWYSPEDDLWEVAVLIWHDDEAPRIRGVRVDPRNGAILGPIDRPWDRDADGFPR